MIARRITMQWIYLIILLPFSVYAKYLEIPDTNFIGERPCSTIERCEDLSRRGDEYARTTLALLYLEGSNKNVSKGLKFLQQSANNKYHLAQAILGMMYQTGDYFKQSDIQAATWMLKSAIGGFALAQYKIGMMYLEGIGVKQSIIQAVYWIKQAAGRGQVDGMRQLGIMYIQGNGVTRDVKRGEAWMRKALEKCHVCG